MATLATMKSRIADEIMRSDLTSQIANAISDAIADHERERFWFNESRSKTFTTVDGQRVYTSSDATWIPDVIEIDDLFVTVDGTNYPLRKEDPAEIELMADSNSAESQPYCWAYLDKSIQLYPIPDQAYTVRALGHVRLAALASDADTNAWTTEAERLIRASAKVLLGFDVVDGLDQKSAMSQSQIVADQLAILRAETSRRKTVGRITPTQF